MEHIRWHSRPTLHRPTLVAAFTGWNDAGDAASTAVRTMIESWDARPLATIDPEEFTDFASTRPHVRLTNGTREIVWPTVSAWHASLPGGDVIFVLGPEPSLRWKTFCDELTELANEMGVRTVISLGALLADVSHNRDVNIIGTATDQDLIDRFDLRRSRYQGPTGIVGVLQNTFSAEGLPTMSFWAAVPAYASQIPSPKAAVALMDKACDAIGVPVPVDALADDVAEYEGRVDRFVEQDRDLVGYVRRLESLADAGIDVVDDDDLDVYDEDDNDEDDDLDDDDFTVEGAPLASLDDGPDSAPLADHLIEEVEQFLRDQGTT